MQGGVSLCRQPVDSAPIRTIEVSVRLHQFDDAACDLGELVEVILV